MMENEEKEDLLVEVTESEEESCEKEEEIDYYIRDKILDFIEKEKKNGKSDKKTSILIASLLIFLSSSVLIVVLPIYAKNSAVNKITTYGKLVTVSAANVVLFSIVHFVRFVPKWKCQWTGKSPMSFFDLLKASLLLCIGNGSIFFLLDDNFVRCHLEDPLKGFSMIFSLIFYYVFSKRKMSIEKTFCAITIIVGVFVSVDFGMCDKFRCYGLSKVTETPQKFHSLFVLLYLLSHGAWVLHLTLIEVCWTTCKDFGSNANPSILSNGFPETDNTQGENFKHLIQNLSIICQEEGGDDVSDPVANPIENCEKSKGRNQRGNSKGVSTGQNDKVPTIGKSADCSFMNSLPCLSQLSLFESKRFPVTSTPKNEARGFNSWSSVRFIDVALWEHLISCLLVVSFCWLATLSISNEGESRLLVDVISDVMESFRFHTGWKSDSERNCLPSLTIVFSISYVILILSSLELLKIVESTVTVVSIMMPALPVSSLFWTLFRINGNSDEILEFNPEITGEAVCAILGLPIIGIGIVLLLKSHMRDNIMAV